MRLVSMTDPPSPSGLPAMGGSGSPTPSTTRPEVVASGNPADAGSGLARGSDGSMVPPPALEGSGEASGRAGSRPLLPGGVLCEFTGYVPTLRPTIAATAAATCNSGTAPRAPQRRAHVISPISLRMAKRNRTEPTHIKREYGQRWNRESRPFRAPPRARLNL